MFPVNLDRVPVALDEFNRVVAAYRGFKDAPDTSAERVVGRALPALPPELSLRFPGELGWTRLLRLQARQDWRGVQPRVCRFAGFVMLWAARLGVPLYAYCPDVWSVRFRHSVFHALLTDDEVAFINSICARVVASRDCDLVLSDADGLWRLSEREPVGVGVPVGSDPVRLSPLALSRMG